MMLATAASAQTKLTLKVHTDVGVNGYDVSSTMISGERDMLVIDPQFSLSEAHKLAAEMRANVVKQYPGLGMEFTLNDRVAAFFPDASKAK
jgi:hypothetical protein